MEKAFPLAAWFTPVRSAPVGLGGQALGNTLVSHPKYGCGSRVFERYRDADAAIEHFADISHLMEPIMATASIIVQGRPACGTATGSMSTMPSEAPLAL